MNARARAFLERHLTGRRQGALGLAIALALALPGARALLEASMWRHMVLQYPLWILVGALLVGVLPSRARGAAARWNMSGISGLLLAGGAIAVLMIPRVLDLALVSPLVEIAKCAALVATGAALRLSWRLAGFVVQSFFLGNMLLMGAAVGQLYANSPLRLCNAYLLGDQQRLGNWLTGISTAVAVIWVIQVMWWIARRESDARAMAGSQIAPRPAPSPPRMDTHAPPPLK